MFKDLCRVWRRNSGQYSLRGRNYKDNGGVLVGSRRWQADLRTDQRLVKKGLGYLAMAAHTDTRVSLQRFTE
jgi:hypothetical protein